jgi:hypothetical protein
MDAAYGHQLRVAHPAVPDGSEVSAQSTLSLVVTGIARVIALPRGRLHTTAIDDHVRIRVIVLP